MADICDQGNEAAELFLKAALSMREETLTGDPHGDRLCVDCWDKIPKPRRLAVPHAIRCLECEEMHQIEIMLRERW